MMAATMTASVVTPFVVPSISYANSKNIVDRILPVDQNFSSDKMPGVLSYLLIKEDDLNFTTGDTFRLTMPAGANWLTGHYSPKTSFSGSNGASLTVLQSTEKDLEMEITGTWEKGTESVQIPLYFEIDGGIGEQKLTVDSRGATLSAGEYTFANVPGEKVVITVPNPKDDEVKNGPNDPEQQTVPSVEEKGKDNKVVFKIGDKTYTQFGTLKTMDVAPFIEANRTYIPIRYIAEAAGIQENEINWDQATGQIKLTKENRVINVTVGSKIMKVNNENMKMDVAPKIVDGRTFLPLRAVAKALGTDVIWNEADKTITVK